MYISELLLHFVDYLLSIRPCLGASYFHETPATCCGSEDIAGSGGTDSEISVDESKQSASA